MGLDLALGCLVLVIAIRGWLKGFLIQAIQLSGLVACVYVADPLRDLVKPEVVGYLPSIAPSLTDRLLWWSSAVVSYVVMVGLASLVLKMHRRRPFGDAEQDRADQFGGFLLGTAKGLIATAFLASGVEKYATGMIGGGGWADEQVKSSSALRWNKDYRPVAHLWALPPVRNYVEHVRRMGLNGPSEESDGLDSEPEPEPVRTASRTTRGPAPRDRLVGPDASGLGSQVDRTIDAIEAELRGLESPKSR